MISEISRLGRGPIFGQTARPEGIESNRVPGHHGRLRDGSASLLRRRYFAIRVWFPTGRMNRWKQFLLRHSLHPFEIVNGAPSLVDDLHVDCPECALRIDVRFCDRLPVFAAVQTDPLARHECPGSDIPSGRLHRASPLIVTDHAAHTATATTHQTDVLPARIIAARVMAGSPFA